MNIFRPKIIFWDSFQKCVLNVADSFDILRMVINDNENVHLYVDYCWLDEFDDEFIKMQIVSD